MDIALHDSLDGQVALVTGANRGIGAAIAAGLADHGATVYAGARDPGTVTDPDVRPVEVDVTEESSIAACVDRVAAEADRLDVLVNNAAVPGPDGAVADGDTAAVDRVLATNLRGPMLTARHALPHLLDREGGRVVNVSSTAGQLSGESDGVRGAYSVSKTGLNGLTASLDGGYGDEGLLANAASPGWVRTDIGGEHAPRDPAEGADTPVWLARFAPGAPAGRFWHDREEIDW